MTQFKDVAHLYIGCKAKDTFNDVILDWNIKNAHMYTQSDSTDQVKPILRPWSDRTNAEVWYMANIDLLVKNIPTPSTEMIMTKANLELTRYLLYCNFDLFGLIESGEAIDATTLTPNPYKNV